MELLEGGSRGKGVWCCMRRRGGERGAGRDRQIMDVCMFLSLCCRVLRVYILCCCMLG